MTHTIDDCPECGHHSIIYDYNEGVCNACRFAIELNLVISKATS